VTTVQATSDLWWKNAVVYCLDVETFLDWNGDGIGDFAGLTQRVDYLAGIGVSCVWLMPFYPTPDRDDGYDVTDFYGVDPRLGTLGDLVEFIRTARDRGIRVIADLVVNHTSDKHPWFRAARSSRTSPYRDFYIWADKPPKDGPKGVTFPDQESSLWQYDDRAGQYYLHRFYRYQPDLNVDNPKVRDEIAKVIGFWMALGLSGFRVDAVPFLIEPTGLGTGGSDPHDYLRDLRAFLSRRSGDAVLLGEVNLPPKDLRKFFGD
jgi:glycosidase